MWAPTAHVLESVIRPHISPLEDTDMVVGYNTVVTRGDTDMKANGTPDSHWWGVKMGEQGTCLAGGTVSASALIFQGVKRRA